MELKDIIKFDDKGLIVAVVQHFETGQVLMVGYMNRESLEVTLRERRACFWSRSRRKLWLKGETSGLPDFTFQTQGRPGGADLPHQRDQLLLPSSRIRWNHNACRRRRRHGVAV